MREVAQIGAVAGRDFHFELLNAVAGLPRERLEEALEQLVRSELVFRRGEIPHAIYTFKHALVRDAAYAGLLKSRRAQLHAAIANALEQEFPEIVQTQPETLAHHLTEAGLSEKAIGYWLQAGKNAALRSANLEAIAHLRRGIELTGRYRPARVGTDPSLICSCSWGRASLPRRGRRPATPWRPSPVRASCASGSGSRPNTFR